MASKKPAPVKVSIAGTLAEAEEWRKRGGRVLWAPQPGPQSEIFLRKEFEIFLGGSKGGGKSSAGIGWLISGNQDVPVERATPIDMSYVNCPQYRALALRANLIDLESWRDEALQVYRPMGAQFRQNPDEFEFLSGAKIILGHLDTADAVYKYFGQVVHRVFLDELTFVANLKTYQRLTSCVRSSVPGIRPQLLLTGNPGGVGHSWVESRFINPIDSTGNIVKPRTTIVETLYNPYLKRNVDITRVFIPAYLSDNRILLESDPSYYNRLAGMDEAEKRAYLFGDWSAFKGEFFGNFRARPREDEPEHACHVVSLKTRKLEPWWPRWIGADWGYKHCSAVFWACQDPNGQVIIYRELVAAEVSAVELGMAIASASREDIQGLERKSLLLHLSPDAFARRDETNTIAELIAGGIQRIYGSKAAYIIETDAMAQTFMADASIGIVRAQNARILGWQYMRELMRWKRPELPGAIEKRVEVLPKLLISDQCPRLIKAIPDAVYDKDGEDVLKTDSPSDDINDAVRYTLAAHKYMQHTEPYQVFHARRMEDVQARHPEGMDGITQFFVEQKIQQDFQGQQHSQPLMIHRASSRRGKMFNRQEWASQRGLPVQ